MGSTRYKNKTCQVCGLTFKTGKEMKNHKVQVHTY